MRCQACGWPGYACPDCGADLSLDTLRELIGLTGEILAAQAKLAVRVAPPPSFHTGGVVYDSCGPVKPIRRSFVDCQGGEIIVQHRYHHKALDPLVEERLEDPGVTFEDFMDEDTDPEPPVRNVEDVSFVPKEPGEPVSVEYETGPVRLSGDEE